MNEIHHHPHPRPTSCAAPRRRGSSAVELRWGTAACVGVALALASVSARADEGRGERSDRGFELGLALTLGEGMYFLDRDVHRGPFSLEVVPSIGSSWFKFDLGLYTTLESVRIGSSSFGNWNFTFRQAGG